MPLTEQELNAYEEILRSAELSARENKVNAMNADIDSKSEEKTAINEQLDLTPELERIYYLLKGYTLTKNSNTGKTDWTEPSSNNMKVLTEYGVQLIMNYIAWYLNKNTLLSNYDEDTINTKMEDFVISLADAAFMLYEKTFNYPTLDDCKEELRLRIQRKVETKSFAYELIQKKVPTPEQREAFEKEIMKDIEQIIEKELDKIKQQLMKDKLKRFELMIRQIQDTVHSSYLRALNGMERKTAREHIHVNETRGINPMSLPQKGIISRIFNK